MIVSEPQWISDSILLLHVRCPPAVLKIIDPALPVEVIVQAAKIDPQVGHLVNEKRSRIQVLYAVDFLPFKRREPLAVAFRINGERRRSQGQRVKNVGFAIARIPPEGQKPRLGLPTMRYGCASVESPLPIDAAIQIISKLPYLAFRLAVRGEIVCRRKNTGHQYGGIDRRQFAFPDPAAGLHVEEVIVEPFVSGGIRFRP